MKKLWLVGHAEPLIYRGFNKLHSSVTAVDEEHSPSSDKIHGPSDRRRCGRLV